VSTALRLSACVTRQIALKNCSWAWSRTSNARLADKDDEIVNFRVNWIGFKTLVRKEILRVLRIWVQTIVPPAITMTLYFIIFGNLIGRRIGLMNGFDYMQYIAPGLIMMSVITNSYGNVVSSFFGAKFGKHVEEMLVSPMSNATIIMGHVAGGVIRGLLVGGMVTVVALSFTNLDVKHPLITFSMVILSSAVFALLGFSNAVFAKKFDDISIIPTFVLTPLTYLGGVFYSISLLPEFWQNVSRGNPILYMVNAFRYGILGTSDISIGFAYLIVGVFVVGLFTVNLLLLNRGVGIRE
jgi:ABC-2 type transport system permease protein